MEDKEGFYEHLKSEHWSSAELSLLLLIVALLCWSCCQVPGSGGPKYHIGNIGLLQTDHISDPQEHRTEEGEKEEGEEVLWWQREELLVSLSLLGMRVCENQHFVACPICTVPLNTSCWENHQQRKSVAFMLYGTENVGNFLIQHGWLMCSSHEGFEMAISSSNFDFIQLIQQL